ncbi:hypothetical protein HBB16_13895 [Pseudonocardia sp. MCCB 268]|nr:hypothetical protein [Pseudonocardia cytotoxica]
MPGDDAQPAGLRPSEETSFEEADGPDEDGEGSEDRELYTYKVWSPWPMS